MKNAKPKKKKKNHVRTNRRKKKKKNESFKLLSLKIIIPTKVVNTHTRGHFYIIRETKYFNTIDTNIQFWNYCYFLIHIY